MTFKKFNWFCANCRDPTTTKYQVQRVFDWMDQVSEGQLSFRARRCPSANRPGHREGTWDKNQTRGTAVRTIRRYGLFVLFLALIDVCQFLNFVLRMAYQERGTDGLLFHGKRLPRFWVLGHYLPMFLKTFFPSV